MLMPLHIRLNLLLRTFFQPQYAYFGMDPHNYFNPVMQSLVEGFRRLNSSFDTLLTGQNHIQASINELHGNVQQLNTSVDRMGGRMDSMEGRLTHLDSSHALVHKNKAKDEATRLKLMTAKKSSNEDRLRLLPLGRAALIPIPQVAAASSCCFRRILAGERKYAHPPSRLFPSP
ncbi:hypothetical protein GUJ93_ZPchr0013g34861 [Zizania palustris]|uniref:Uncharacterized protein n=1 Tax=Zizania palustris TaxID=103762 RepID=A0A8J6C092_ZIZPA|nr:hypothetical protein GUJ93_ZPchr0013g34861 [Zizania palustris]